jgi:drug/metabolite transporter (DMT)-like permease
MNNDKNYKGHMAMLAASIIWGLNAPIGKAALDYGIPPLALTTFRFFGAAIAFWFISLFTKKEHVKHEDLLMLFFASLFGIVLNQGTFIFGLSLTSPIDASIVNTMAPIITMIVVAIILKEPITGKKVLGVFVGAIGALILILTSQAVTGGKSGNIAGDLLCLTAQLSFAIYLTVFKGLIEKYSSVTIMKWMFIYASMCFIPFSYNDIASINFAAVPLKVFGEISFVVFAATFLAYILLMAGQKTLRPTIVSMYNYVQPIVASFVAVSVGMDTFGWPKATAIILVFVGVFIVTQSKSKAQLDAEVLYQEIDQPKEKIKENDY